MSNITKSRQAELVEEVHEYSININTREIFIAPDKDGEGEVEHLTSIKVIKNIRLLNTYSHEPILIHLGTCGGEWNYSMMIYDAIAISPSRVITLSYAYASSMSSIIPQAADLRVITENCDFMIHEGTFCHCGTSKVVSSNVKWNDYLSKVMLNIYSERCQHGPHFKGWSIKRIEAFLKKKMDEKEDWFITAEDAVKYGFMDGVLGTEEFEDIETIRNKE